jgi:hypothetical protein
MDIYFNLGHQIPQWVPICDPQWHSSPEGTWRGEFLSAVYMRSNGLNRVRGDFCHNINTFGRSRYTDKHYHHGIAQDPTQQ